MRLDATDRAIVAATQAGLPLVAHPYAAVAEEVGLSEAELITDEAHAQLRLLDAARQVSKVVGAYLADVRSGPNGPEPVHFREDFRRTGPSNYAHGKQETSPQPRA